MVFVSPVFHTFEHELAHQRLFRSSLVATAGTVAWLSVGSVTVVRHRESAVEIASFDVESMVVNHIENNANACFVQGLYHLFELKNAAGRLLCIERITAFRHVIVLWIVAPIVLWGSRVGFVYRSKVERWQNVNGVYT